MITGSIIIKYFFIAQNHIVIAAVLCDWDGNVGDGDCQGLQIERKEIMKIEKLCEIDFVKRCED